jgi:hypothetical protein
MERPRIESKLILAPVLTVGALESNLIAMRAGWLVASKEGVELSAFQ